MLVLSLRVLPWLAPLGRYKMTSPGPPPFSLACTLFVVNGLILVKQHRLRSSRCSCSLVSPPAKPKNDCQSSGFSLQCRTNGMGLDCSMMKNHEHPDSCQSVGKSLQLSSHAVRRIKKRHPLQDATTASGAAHSAGRPPRTPAFKHFLE